MANNNHAPYFKVVADNVLRDGMVEIICNQLEPHKDKFDSIVACGCSMLGISPIVSYLMNKQLVIVRKDGEKTHSDKQVEFHDNPENYIIIDDMVASGKTIRYIRETMDKHTYGKLVAVYEYLDMFNMIRYSDNYQDVIKRNKDPFRKLQHQDTGWSSILSEELYNKYYSVFKDRTL